MFHGNHVKWAWFRVVAIAVVVVVGNSSAFGQVSASLSGRIEDSSGAGIPQATVEVTSQETGVKRTVASDESGNYRVLSLPVGRYEIRAEKSGFKAAVQTGISLVVDQQAVVNLTLEVGQVQQEVTVTAEAPLVNTSTTSISGLVGEQAVKDLPLNGRSFDMLITLDAGTASVKSDSAGGAGELAGNEFSISGRQFGENLFLLNGVEYMGPSQTHSEPEGASGQLLGVDAVREFNVVADTYGAEYGKRAGGQVSIVTQSGSNVLHGTVFEFLRNSVLDARNYYDHPLGERIPPFKRNQFGAALGGPIQKDKTFIFGNYEGFRQRLGVSDVATVPNANARLGILPCGIITPIPSGCKGTTDTTPVTVPNLKTGMLPYLNVLWPTPNGPDLGGGVAEAFDNPLQSIRDDFATIRVDHVFSSKDTLGTSYLLDDGYNLTPQPDANFAMDTRIRTQVFSLEETHIFSPNVINTATFGISRATWRYQAPALVNVPSNLLFVTGEFLGRVIVGGSGSNGSGAISNGGGGVATNVRTFRTMFTYKDGIQVIKGRHQISAGVLLGQVGSNEFAPMDQGGVVTFASLITLLQGTASSFLATPVRTTLRWRQLEGAWYVQDAIQLRPNLTVQLGLRHEFTNGWNEKYGRASDFVYGPNGALLTAPVVGNSPFTVNNSKWLFGPRVGIAWDPFGKGKTSVRAAFGTYYDINDDLGDQALDSLPPYNGAVSFTNVSLLSFIPVNPSTPVPPTCGPGVLSPCTTYAVEGVSTALKTPTVEEWTLAVEQEITPNTSLTLSYVGSHGFHGLLQANGDVIAPQICSNAAGCTSGGTGSARGAVAQGALYIPVGTLPNPFLGSGVYTYSSDNTSYNALNVELTHRYSYGLQFRANYTWSREEDFETGFGADTAATSAAVVLDPYNPKLDFGPASDNKTNKFVLSGGYELPFGKNKPWLSGLTGVGNKLASGWQLNAIVTATSGFAFDPEIGTNRSGDGDTKSPDRPSWNPAFTGPVITGNPAQWFNPNAFILPTVGTFGNVGRNALVGPNLRELDMSLFKTTSITERVSLQFRAEGFNVLNHANFNVPGITVFSSGAISPTAGLITATATTSRQLQFGLKLLF